MIDAEIELKNLENSSSRHYKWVEHFLKYQNVSELTREMVIELVDAVMVYDKNHIEIILAFQDEYEEAVNELKIAMEGKEVAACG